MIGQKKEFVARTKAGLDYEAQLKWLNDQLTNPSPEFEQELRDMAQLFREKALSPGAVSTTPVLQQLAVSYRNDDYIGLNIMPAVNTVSDLGLDDGALSCIYWAKTKRDTFDPGPSDLIGTRGTVNEVEETFSQTSTTLQRRGLKRFIDAWTDAAMDSVVRRMVNPLIMISDKLALKQEIRIAAIAGVSTYFGSNTAALSGTDQWNSSTGGDPKGAVDTAKSACYHGGPGRWVGACSENVYNVLKRHPIILDSFKYVRGGGFANREMLAEYFELDALYVGMAKYTSTVEGQTTQSQSAIWPDVFGVYRVAEPVGVDVVTFGVTIESPKFQSQWFKNGDGGRGGFNTQVAFADKSVVIAADAGYLYTTPIG